MRAVGSPPAARDCRGNGSLTSRELRGSDFCHTYGICDCYLYLYLFACVLSWLRFCVCPYGIPLGALGPFFARVSPRISSFLGFSNKRAPTISPKITKARVAKALSLLCVHARGTKRKQTEHTHAKKRDTVRGHREIVFARFPRVAVRTELQSSLRALLVGLNLCLIKGFHVA